MELKDNETRTKIKYYVDRKNVSARYMDIGWFERMEIIPESKITKVSVSPVEALTVTSRFKEYVKGNVPVLPNDYNNRFTLTVKNGNVEETFDYGVSINDTKSLKPKIVLTDKDHICAFYCFLTDAIAGSMTFKEFQLEYGYKDCCEAYKIWKACKESALKVLRLGIGDMYDILNYIQEKYPDVI
jgi:hypothetical protein